MERHGWKYITLAAAALLDGGGKKGRKAAAIRSRSGGREQQRERMGISRLFLLHREEAAVL